MTATSSETPPGLAPASCRVRTVLDRIGDKWAIYVVDRLGAGPRRFSELLRGIDGITARMLTVTLRGLERDGLLTRTVHASLPPALRRDRGRLGRLLAGAGPRLPDGYLVKYQYSGRKSASGLKPTFTSL